MTASLVNGAREGALLTNEMRDRTCKEIVLHLLHWLHTCRRRLQNLPLTWTH